MAIVCNRLAITGHVSERTPLIVLKEIMLAHNITFEEGRTDPDYIRAVVKSIYNVPVYSLKVPLSRKSYNTLKRYLDISDEGWTEQEVLSIHQYWTTNHENISSDQRNDISIEYIGQPTRSCPYSLNACFLYRICKNKNPQLELPFNISLDNLAVIAKLSSDSVNSCVDIINTVLLRGDMNEILPFIVNTPIRYLGQYAVPKAYIKTDIVTYEMLEVLTNNRIFMQSRRTISPRNDTEAIALAAYNYNINLFYAGNPLREFFELRSQYTSMSSSIPYIPQDIMMRQIYDKNPNLVRLITFDSRIPHDFYNAAILCSAIENEGYTRSELESENPYELLQVAYLSETFHQGWFPNISNHESPFLFDDISSIPKENLICFGCRAENLIAMSFSEVAGMFRSSGSFLNRILGPSGGFFSNIAIRKLRKICLTVESAGNECLREIDAIDSLNATGGESLRFFLRQYDRSTEECKNNVRNTLKKLVDLAMYMRGWDGTTASCYPPNSSSLNQHEIDVKVTEAVTAFEQSLNLCGFGFTASIRSLPIFKYINSTFIISNTPDEGVTLGERFDLMKRGDAATNINSCIRLTSNWFAASAYRYYQVLRLPVPFDIDNLRWVT